MVDPDFVRKHITRLRLEKAFQIIKQRHGNRVFSWRFSVPWKVANKKFFKRRGF